MNRRIGLLAAIALTLSTAACTEPPDCTGQAASAREAADDHALERRRAWVQHEGQGLLLMAYPRIDGDEADLTHLSLVSQGFVDRTGRTLSAVRVRRIREGVPETGYAVWAGGEGGRVTGPGSDIPEEAVEGLEHVEVETTMTGSGETTRMVADLYFPR